VLCVAAGLHANDARLPVGKVLEELLALSLQARDFSGLHVDRVQLKYPFGDIDTDYIRFCYLTFRTLRLACEDFRIFHLWHFDAVGP
jgi:hypothetical protein